MRWLGPLLLLLGGGLVTFWAGQPAGWVSLAAAPLVLVLGRTGKMLLAVLLALVTVATAVGLWGQGSRPALLVGLAVTLAGAVLVALTARSWPQHGDRYSRSRAAVTSDASALDQWKAMDAGHDPTAADTDSTAHEQ